MYAIRSYYAQRSGAYSKQRQRVCCNTCVITSYSIHYTKLYELQNSADLNVTIKNLHGSISKNGHIYIDIAKPWNHNRNEAHLLPEFMRFSDEHILEGESVFMMDNIGELKRNFTSKINEEYVVVNFDFCAKFFDGKDSSNYNMKYQWRNITRITSYNVCYTKLLRLLRYRWNTKRKKDNYLLCW